VASEMIKIKLKKNNFITKLRK